jgi:hypothetical protein
MKGIIALSFVFAPGEFYVLHHMNTDSKGNLYTTEVQDGKRAQKFVFMGMEKK